MKKIFLLLCLALAASAQTSLKVLQSTDPASYIDLNNNFAYLLNYKLHYAGAWSSTATYGQSDLVVYSGATYISLVPANTGNTPSGTGIYWAQLPGGGGAITTVFGRTGVVTAQAGDYNTDQVPEGTTNQYLTTARVRSAMNGLYQAPISGAPGTWPSTFPPSPHAASHYTGGTDQLSLDGGQITTGIVPIIRLPACGASGSGHLSGLVPDPGLSAGTTRYLREDCTWVAVTGSNAVQLQSRVVASTAPTDMQYLGWNNGANQWEPKTAWYQNVQANGSAQTQRSTINLTNGTNITVSCSDVSSITTCSFSVAGTLAVNTSGNAATASALAGTPSLCTGTQLSTGISANGNANCRALASSDLPTGTGTAASVVTVSATSGTVAFNCTSNTTNLFMASGGNPITLTGNMTMTSAGCVPGQFVSVLFNSGTGPYSITVPTGWGAAQVLQQPSTATLIEWQIDGAGNGRNVSAAGPGGVGQCSTASAPPGNPPPGSGVLFTWCDSSANTLLVKDTSGNIYAAVKTTGSRTANQFVTYINSSGVPQTAAISSADLPAQYTKFSCTGGWGDGLNAITAGTYVQFSCVNTTGVTWTITGINCYTDNAGTTTLNAANNAATGLLTGAVTCNATKSGGGAAGTQSGTTTLANNDAITFTGVADGTSKQITYTVTITK